MRAEPAHETLRNDTDPPPVAHAIPRYPGLHQDAQPRWAALMAKERAAAPELVVTKNPWTSTMRLIGELKADRRLWIGGLITSWFWLVGAVVLSLLPPMVKDTIGGDAGLITAQLNFHDMKVPFLGTNGWNSPDFARTADSSIDGAVCVRFWGAFA